jgi:hypothetical protein
MMRTMRHKKYIDMYIAELRWEILNITITASRTQWNDDVVALLDNSAQLIRKYERRRRWLKL